MSAAVFEVLLIVVTKHVKTEEKFIYIYTAVSYTP